MMYILLVISLIMVGVTLLEPSFAQEEESLIKPKVYLQAENDKYHFGDKVYFTVENPNSQLVPFDYYVRFPNNQTVSDDSCLIEKNISYEFLKPFQNVQIALDTKNCADLLEGNYTLFVTSNMDAQMDDDKDDDTSASALILDPKKFSLNDHFSIPRDNCMTYHRDLAFDASRHTLFVAMNLHCEEYTTDARSVILVINEKSNKFRHMTALPIFVHSLEIDNDLEILHILGQVHLSVDLETLSQITDDAITSNSIERLESLYDERTGEFFHNPHVKRIVHSHESKFNPTDEDEFDFTDQNTFDFTDEKTYFMGQFGHVVILDRTDYSVSEIDLQDTVSKSLLASNFLVSEDTGHVYITPLYLNLIYVFDDEWNYVEKLFLDNPSDTTNPEIWNCKEGEIPVEDSYFFSEEICTKYELDLPKVRHLTDKKESGINIAPQRIQIEPGEPMRFNGTAVPDRPLEVILEDPTGKEIHTDILDIGRSGLVDFQYQTSSESILGTYLLFATQQDLTEIIPIGVGQLPQDYIAAKTDKLGYKSSEISTVYVSGSPSSTLSLTLSYYDDQIFSDVVHLDEHGRATYYLSLKDYSVGVYFLTLHNDSFETVEVFTIGTVDSRGPIDIQTAEYVYDTNVPISVMVETHPKVLVTLHLIDTFNKVIAEKEIFSDEHGHIRDDTFKVPISGESGIWKIKAVTDSNFDIAEIEVRQIISEQIVVLIEDTKIGPDIGNVINFHVFGAHDIVTVSIADEHGDEIDKMTFTANKSGELTKPWIIPASLPSGEYKITTADAFNSASASFIIAANGNVVVETPFDLTLCNDSLWSNSQIDPICIQHYILASQQNKSQPIITNGVITNTLNHPQISSMTLDVQMHDRGYVTIPNAHWYFADDSCEVDAHLIALLDEAEVDFHLHAMEKAITLQVSSDTKHIEILGAHPMVEHTTSGAFGHFCMLLEQNVTHLPPVKQMEIGFLKEDVICMDNHVLILKHDGSPACVTPETKVKLFERGWQNHGNDS